MPSITTFNRLEPSPASADITGSLAARLRDPAWLLARQWQMGEFQGEDAGSPAYAAVTVSTATPVAWHGAPDDRTPPSERALASGPLDAVVTRDELGGEDVALAVELGQTFEMLLRNTSAGEDAVSAFRAAFPVGRSGAGDDPETVRFRSVAAGRAVDGIALFRATVAGGGGIPHTVDGERVEPKAARKALRQFVAWVRELYGPLTGEDSPAWRPERLEYKAKLVVGADESAGPGESPALGAGKRSALSVIPRTDGTLDWYSFDAESGAIATGGRQVTAMLPGHVRFRGMPNARFWDFESAATDFGDVRPDRRDLARLAFMDFMLLAANDWFLIPLDQRVGTLARVEQLTVTDVFGGESEVPPAGSGDPEGPVRWSMFATATATGTATATAKIFFLAPTAAGALQSGEVLEEVRILRDETANLAWAVERTVANGVGRPSSRLEHELASRPELPPPPPSPAADAAPLRYRLQSDVPAFWFPLAPVVIDGAGQIALELGSMLDPDGIHLRVNTPAGRILRPSPAPSGSYQLREEEVPRMGLRVTRLPYLSRWVDGTTHLWSARGRALGAKEGSSGLLFDLAEPHPGSEPGAP